MKNKIFIEVIFVTLFMASMPFISALQITPITTSTNVQLSTMTNSAETNAEEITGIVQGVVYRPGWHLDGLGFSPNIVAGATVRISSLFSPQYYSETNTSDDGAYYFFDVPMGIYIVTAQHPDYSSSIKFCRVSVFHQAPAVTFKLYTR